MEAAIPLVTLGLFYILSNEKKREGFNNLNQNQLPNTQQVPVNYPIENKNAGSVNRYKTPNQSTDKYFINDMYKKKTNGESLEVTNKEFQSLTGNYVNEQDFKHNNQKPFFIPN